MIVLLVCAIVSTVLASSCWFDYASLLATAGETIPMVFIAFLFFYEICGHSCKSPNKYPYLL